MESDSLFSKEVCFLDDKGANGRKKKSGELGHKPHSGIIPAKYQLVHAKKMGLPYV